MDNTVNTFYRELKIRVKESNYYTEERLELRPYANHQTIRMCETAVIRIVQLKSRASMRLEVAKRFLKFFKIEDEIKIRKPDPPWVKIPFDATIVKKVLENAKTIFEECYKEGAVESYGCCSRYVECSNNNKCVHPDIREARGCIYKHNLERGRIFYGDNCNVNGNKNERSNQAKQR